jgi:hypothetical protein
MQLDAGHLLVQWGVTVQLTRVATRQEVVTEHRYTHRSQTTRPLPWPCLGLASRLPEVHMCTVCSCGLCRRSSSQSSTTRRPRDGRPIQFTSSCSSRPAALFLHLSSCTFLPDTVCTGTTFSLPASRNARCHWGSLTLAGSHGPSFSSFPTDVAASIVSFRPLPHFS